MEVRNDCLQQDTLTIEINGQCNTITDLVATNGGGVIENDKLDMILNLMEQYNKCCMNNTMMLYQQQGILKDILNRLILCGCKYPKPITKPVYVGQVVKDFTIIDITPIQPSYNYIQQEKPVYIKPKPVVVETPYYPVVDRNAFSIMGIGGSWNIVNNDIVSGGVSLRRKIPVKLNIKNGDKILESIIDYRIIMGGGLYPKQEPILAYQILNTTTGTRTTFEAGPNHYRKWFR